ncbi:MAG: hypothetical protein A2505_09135 [Deltaproteobacteria bacterium RIFOXYD12_FULL_55_16]|nr:MAG: hypothetical protein A2505_09135 [Deltaproteobacteria bacterium RIFOXYD12_FULL_55_16]
MTAFALHQQGALDQAEKLYQEILHSQPQHLDALQLLARVALQQKKFTLAIELFDRALKINPHDPSAFCNRGIALLELKRYDEALESYDRTLRLNPDDADAFYSRGNALLALKRHEDALESYDQVLKIKPDYPGALNNSGNALLALGRPEEALESYGRALKFKLDCAGLLHNCGKALLALNRHAEALDNYAHALRLKPDYADAHWNESLCRLLLGDFALGWQKHEWRLKSPQVDASKNFQQPLWLGEAPLAGKTLLLHAEQGLGDTLQFCRYAPLAAAQGARVVLAVPSALKVLCQTLADVDTLLAIGDPLPPFDFHAPLMSLPLAFGTRLDSIPAEVPYLHADSEKTAAWNILLGPRDKPRVGLAWSGRPTHKNDHNRSLPFALLAGLLEYPAEFICLQKEFHHEDEALARQHSRMRIFSEQLQDFADTAALIETLDLVITIDTSVAHLAGALGKPVWILLPFAPDWRWLLDRGDSPWYPSARLFRQQQLGQWAPVLAEVRRALHEI